MDEPAVREIHEAALKDGQADDDQGINRKTKDQEPDQWKFLSLARVASPMACLTIYQQQNRKVKEVSVSKSY
jgi:hypothetical protein